MISSPPPTSRKHFRQITINPARFPCPSTCSAQISQGVFLKSTREKPCFTKHLRLSSKDPLENVSPFSSRLLPQEKQISIPSLLGSLASCTATGAIGTTTSVRTVFLSGLDVIIVIAPTSVQDFWSPYPSRVKRLRPTIHLWHIGPFKRKLLPI